jgi:hypothetical protein
MEGGIVWNWIILIFVASISRSMVQQMRLAQEPADAPSEALLEANI